MIGRDKYTAIKLGFEQWEEKTTKRLEKFPERKNLRLKRLYTPLDIQDNNYLGDLGFPGEYPFTRGVQSTMYRARLWTMRQYAGFATAEESNERYKYLLANGQTGLSVAFDLPTQIGYDSDNPLAEGEVGKVGVAIDSLDDMEILFTGIPLDKVSTSMTINAPAAVLLAMYIVVAEKQGVQPHQLQGTIQNDILKEYIARGTYIFPPEQSMRLVTDIFDYCTRKMPKWNMISVGGYHIREFGTTAAQEIAFSFANAIAYIEAAQKVGLEVESFAPNISWVYSSDLNFLEEIAKFRAARRLWARIMKERFAITNPKGQLWRVHAHSSGSVLTSQQIDNNIVRTTWQTMAAILGGVQSFNTCTKDEAIALPTDESVRLALRTQQLLAFESGITDTVDPFAGSYCIETLSDGIETEAMDYIKKIDEMGGVLEAIKNGYLQREMADSAYRYQKEIEANTRIRIGVNKYISEERQNGQFMVVDPAVGIKQVGKIRQLKEKRDNSRVASALAALEKAARNTINIMPYIISTVEVYATLGEICDVLRNVFGEYKGDTKI